MSARAIATLVAAAMTLALHAVVLPAQGLTDDDDFYAPAGIRYASWLGDALTSPATTLQRAAVDAAFKANHEHPPLAKMVFGVTHALAHDALGVSGELDAARLGTALFAALLAGWMVWLLWATLGAPAACAAPLLLLSLPRFFFHSEVATLDVPVAAAVFAVTAAFFAAERSTSPWAPRAAGVIFGLGLLVKLNAPFAIVPCAAWAILSRWRGFAVRDAALVVPPVPRALVWMALLGPVLFVALWPWLWFETADRVAGYIAFHLNHYPIYLFYDGAIWERPFAPWHAVLVLGFGSMPAPVVALGVLGALRATRALVRLAKHADRWGRCPDVDHADKLRALVLLQAAFSLAIVMNPSVPRYGGEKLFMPFFPLWCVLAADGVLIVVDAVRRLTPRVTPAPAFIVVTALACAPGFAATVAHHGGYALSYYGELVGGLRGAVARGYERTYYDVADKALAEELAARARDEGGLRVTFEPNHKEYARTYRWLKRDGVVRGPLTLEADRKKAALVVLTHERRWASYPALWEELVNSGAYERVLDKSIDGVPLYTVFRRR